MNCFEFPINWRLARISLLRSASSILFSDQVPTDEPTGSLVVLPRKLVDNILSVRDWLHNDENTIRGYTMCGCFKIDSKQRTVLTDLKFYFDETIDAAYFHLRWGGSTLLPE
jgi:hypothetical protein